jgi:hypothetical protein
LKIEIAVIWCQRNGSGEVVYRVEIPFKGLQTTASRPKKFGVLNSALKCFVEAIYCLLVTVGEVMALAVLKSLIAFRPLPRFCCFTDWFAHDAHFISDTMESEQKIPSSATAPSVVKRAGLRIERPKRLTDSAAKKAT